VLSRILHAECWHLNSSLKCENLRVRSFRGV
jgi:hypothetical protein